MRINENELKIIIRNHADAERMRQGMPIGRRVNQRIFQEDYVRDVLGIQIPLNESSPWSMEMRERIIEEQLLFEGFFSDFKDLAGNMKNFALGLRYVMEDPSRIKQFVKLVMAGVQEKFDKLKAAFTKLIKVLDKMAKAKDKELAKKMKSKKFSAEGFKKYLTIVLKSIINLYQGVRKMDGWKQAAVSIGAATGITYVFNTLTDVAPPLTDEEKVAQIEAAFGALAGGLKTLKGEGAMVYSNAILEAGLVGMTYGPDGERVDEFLGKLKDKAKGAIDKVKDKVKGDKSGEGEGESEEKSGGDEGGGSDLDKLLIQPALNMMKSIGKSVVKNLALDAVLGAVSGGVGALISWARKAFKGAKTMVSAVGPAVEKFIAKVKGDKGEAKEAEAGKGDPTAGKGGEEKKPEEGEKKNEARIRKMVRDIMLSERLY